MENEQIMQKYNFVDSKGDSYLFWIIEYYHIDEHDPVFIIEACYFDKETSHDKHKMNLPYSQDIPVYRNKNSLEVRWDHNSINTYQHIIGYKEYIDRIVSMLIFS